MTANILTPLAVLIFAALTEIACVFWVHYSERGDAFKAALLSATAATVAYLAYFFTLPDIHRVVALAAGYGLGAWIGVKIKSKKASVV